MDYETALEKQQFRRRLRQALETRGYSDVVPLVEARQIVPSLLAGAPPGGAGGKPKEPFLEQMMAQVPRLEREFAARIAAREVPPLTRKPLQVYEIVKPVVNTTPSIKHFFGADYPRWGGEYYQYFPRGRTPAEQRQYETWVREQNLKPPEARNPGSANPDYYYRYYDERRGYGSPPSYYSDYGSPEEAKLALLRRAIEYQRTYLPSFKPVKPQISEFASPEDARRSWRLLEQELK